MLEGDGKAVLDGVEARITAGTVILIPSDQTHQLQNHGSARLRVLCAAAPAFSEAAFASAHDLSGGD